MTYTKKKSFLFTETVFYLFELSEFQSSFFVFSFYKKLWGGGGCVGYNVVPLVFVLISLSLIRDDIKSLHIFRGWNIIKIYKNKGKDTGFPWGYRKIFHNNLDFLFTIYISISWIIKIQDEMEMHTQSIWILTVVQCVMDCKLDSLLSICHKYWV